MFTEITQPAKENFLGKILQFDERLYNTEVLLWERKIIPLIQVVVNSYKVFNIGPLTDERFRRFIVLDFANLEIDAFASIDKDFEKKLGISLARIARNEIAGRVDEFKKVVRELVTTFDQAVFISSAIRDNLSNSWNDLKIIDEQPIINYELIKKRHSTIIENEVQNDLYNRLVALENSWNELVQFVNANGYDTNDYPFFGYGGFVSLEDDNRLVANPESVRFFRG